MSPADSTPTTARAALRVTGRWLSRLLVAVMVVAVVGILAVLTVIPKVTNGAALTVLTGSMTPEIPVGSVVVIRPVDPASLRVGDVATYQAAPGKASYVTHRIQRIDATSQPARFVFKGDANRGADTDPVPADAIRGKVWFHVPFLGAARDALHGKGGIGLVAMLLLGGYAATQIASVVRERRRGAAAQSEELPTPEPGDLLAVTFDVDRLCELTGLEARDAVELLLRYEPLSVEVHESPVATESERDHVGA